MNIMVFDVPAVNGGALSLLNDFYKEVINNKDKKNKWVFVVSKPQLKEVDNIKVLNFPWIKKSWAHRVFFDNFIAKNLVEEYDIDIIVSLQNVTIPGVKKKQILYVHNCLPFVDYKFRFREDKLLWFYQKVIGKRIINSLKISHKVIVQTEWMKKSCSKIKNVSKEKIEVIPPKIELKVTDTYKEDKNNEVLFFYPASGVVFKNHKILVESCEKLLKKNKNFKMLFTLNGTENKNIISIYNEVKSKKLPIEFIGALDREDVFNLYKKAILVFPSFIETFGLPLLEAKMHDGLILASDSLFSKEVLADYNNAYYFDPFNSNDLYELMKKIVDKKIIHNENHMIIKDEINPKTNIVNCILEYNNKFN